MIEQPRKLDSNELRNETMGRAFKLAALLPQSAWKHANRPRHRKQKHRHPKHGKS
jgi:hypothetical protein